MVLTKFAYLYTPTLIMHVDLQKSIILCTLISINKNFEFFSHVITHNHNIYKIFSRDSYSFDTQNMAYNSLVTLTVNNWSFVHREPEEEDEEQEYEYLYQDLLPEVGPLEMANSWDVWLHI